MIYDPEYLKDDWAKDRQAQESLAEEFIRPAPKRPHYYPEDTKDDILSAIEQGNIAATTPNRFHGIWSPDWSENHE